MVFKTFKRKFGKTLAFVDAHIETDRGVSLAFARHVKFQPMGVLEYATKPPLKPFFYRGLESYLSLLAPHAVEEPSTMQVRRQVALDFALR